MERSIKIVKSENFTKQYLLNYGNKITQIYIGIVKKGKSVFKPKMVNIKIRKIIRLLRAKIKC